MEQRHNDLRADYCGLDGNTGWKNKVETAMEKLREKDNIDAGFRRGVNKSIADQELRDKKNARRMNILIGIGILIIAILTYAYTTRVAGHVGLFSLHNSSNVVAVDSTIRDTSR